MDTDVEKLRRFCIIIALVLITYVLADISIPANAEIKILDMPFVVKRSDLVPIGIVLASFLGMVRFFYYGFLKNVSPYRKRRGQMDCLEVFVRDERRPVTKRDFVSGGRKDTGKTEIEHVYQSGKAVWMYFGAPSIRVSGKASGVAAGLAEMFPRRGYVGAQTKDEYCFGHPDTQKSHSDTVLTIPTSCRLGAMFEDFDYSAPIWLNALALLMYLKPFLSRLLGPLRHYI